VVFGRGGFDDDDDDAEGGGAGWVEREPEGLEGREEERGSLVFVEVDEAESLVDDAVEGLNGLSLNDEESDESYPSSLLLLPLDAFAFSLPFPFPCFPFPFPLSSTSESDESPTWIAKTLRFGSAIRGGERREGGEGEREKRLWPDREEDEAEEVPRVWEKEGRSIVGSSVTPSIFCKVPASWSWLIKRRCLRTSWWGKRDRKAVSVSTRSYELAWGRKKGAWRREAGALTSVTPMIPTRTLIWTSLLLCWFLPERRPTISWARR
jgi:hypothetical protein